MYFANSDLNGQPAFSVVDRRPSTDAMRQRWDGVLPERFSVRWTGFITVGRGGLYNFATASDDGLQLFVDNRVVVDNGGQHGLTRLTGAIQLAGGSHSVELRYVQFAAVSALDGPWAREGADFSPVPAAALTQRRTTYPRVFAGQLVEWGFVIFAGLVAILAGWYIRVALARNMVIRWVTTDAAPGVSCCDPVHPLGGWGPILQIDRKYVSRAQRNGDQDGRRLFGLSHQPRHPADR